MKKDDCIFCKLANGEIPTNALYEDDIVKVIFDASPAAKGHVLILPKEHFDNIYELDDDTAAHVFKVAAKISKAYKKALDFDGLNIVQNNGEVAGQRDLPGKPLIRFAISPIILREKWVMPLQRQQLTEGQR